MTASPRRQSGFTFLWLLFLVAGLGVSMAAIGTLWHSANQRGKEAELLFIGDQYRRAIESFSQAAPPDGHKRLPKTLEELLLDPRFQHTVRHLRRAYPDPMTGKAEWGLVKDAKGYIVGVHSLSAARPIKSAGFLSRYEAFSSASQYQDWKFTATASLVQGADGVVLPAAGTPQDAQQQSRFDACIKPHDAALAECEAAKSSENIAAYHLCRRSAIDAFNACNAGSP